MEPGCGWPGGNGYTFDLLVGKQYLGFEMSLPFFYREGTSSGIAWGVESYFKLGPPYVFRTLKSVMLETGLN